MIEDVLRQARERMEARVENFRRELAAVRAGRATPALLEKIRVDYYGTPTPIHQLATITAPEPRMLVVQPWDKSVMGEIEKAIAKSDLGVNPSSDGQVIRIVLPPLTEETRNELVKRVRKMAEEERVAVRNVRRQANDDLKELEDQGFSEDEIRRAQEKVQELTDRTIARIDELLAAKEKEIREV
ncbi:ribosome recycling factor [Thermaerobacter marianensis DSM 12885]|uniref:Ribosome-recycling factor n=1 Tax=Thermaerobacter marianensis (strain ATCC 700841 / DSM 12885 / JCM 10246 / 7p75a) TaxID=644966 RepID=E6SJQ6_THEM7|nr:ribosome recycling factor [Thermaerobacter marianensis]ADU51119.1 ribosome recycling factor [Thermaerobacter marianensis DSM 12885]